MAEQQLTFDRPLIISADEVSSLDGSKWSSGENWINAIQDAATKSTVKGIVLPLELKCQGYARQQLFGMELLNWLRWSADDSVRFVPVLAVAWQPLPLVLRKSMDLLLIAANTLFMQLPMETTMDGSTLRSMLDRIPHRKAPSAIQEDLNRFANVDTSQAARATYHALANDNYAAYRLWKGYSYALQSVLGSNDPLLVSAAHRTLDRLTGNPPSFASNIDRKRQQPWFRKLEATRSAQRLPAYPVVENSNEVLRRHLLQGVNRPARILFVDDEFTKGTAEVILQILFGKSPTEFIKRDNEWIYAEVGEDPGHRKARLVCVNSAKLARMWLRKWSILSLEENTDFDDWQRDWDSLLRSNGLALDKAAGGSTRSYEKHPMHEIDDDEMSPVKMKTILLLDLRLDPQDMVQNYSTSELSSVVLRSEVKEADPDIPVLMFTASRQATNFWQVMSVASEIDGWLVKEAPDVLEEDTNSSQAALYLLSRIHLFCERGDWYRSDLQWDDKSVREVNALYESEYADACASYVGETATSLFDRMAGDLAKGDDPFSEFWAKNQHVTAFMGFINEQSNPPAFPKVVSYLIARRFAVAALLLTAKALESQEWDLTQFTRCTRGSARAESFKFIYQAVSFGRDLNIQTSRVPILSQLLKNEYEWLLSLNWPCDRAALIVTEIRRFYQNAYPPNLLRNSSLTKDRSSEEAPA